MSDKFPKPDINGWFDIETAPSGFCLMWVIGGSRRRGRAVSGTVFALPDGERHCFPNIERIEPVVTHWQPLPLPPVGAA